MFFGNSKLEKEIAQKDALINKLKLDMQSLKSKHRDELKPLKKELANATNELSSLRAQHEEYVRKVEESTDLEIMSGAHNKRYFYDIVESMISLAKREKSTMSIAVVHIDKLSQLDEEHPMTNKIIQTLVHRISNQIRESDVFARLDKAKFAIVFLKTPLEKAKVVCEKIRTKVKEKPAVEDLYFSLSVGITEFLENDNINSALLRAEELINTSKKSHDAVLCS